MFQTVELDDAELFQLKSFVEKRTLLFKGDSRMLAIA